MAKIQPVTLIAVIIVVALLMTPQIIAGFGDLIGKGWESWQDIFSSGDGDISAGGYSGLGLTIHYMDGSKKEFTPSAFSTIPLDILDAGGKVSKLTAIIYITPIATESSSQWDVSGDLKVNYKEQARESVLATETKTVSVSESGTWHSGQTRPVQSFSFLASHIQNKVASHGEDTYHMTFDCEIELVFHFADGSTDSKAATATTTWTFQYSTGSSGGSGSGELTSISVRIDSVALRPGGSNGGR